jgi:hypothetical protein
MKEDRQTAILDFIRKQPLVQLRLVFYVWCKHSPSPRRHKCTQPVQKAPSSGDTQLFRLNRVYKAEHVIDRLRGLIPASIPVIAVTALDK